MSDVEARERRSQRERAKRAAAAAALRPDKPVHCSVQEIKLRNRERMAAKALLRRQQLEQQQVVRDKHMIPVNDSIFNTLGRSYNCHGRLKNDLACGQEDHIGKCNKYRI
jgi:hypothetical protein